MSDKPVLITIAFDDLKQLHDELADKDAEIARLAEQVTIFGGVVGDLECQRNELREENRRLREALGPFARIAPYLGVLPDRESISDLHDFTAAEVRRAAKEMEE